MMEEILDYGERCPKCGWSPSAKRYILYENLLICMCGFCGHHWKMRPKDYKEPGAERLGADLNAGKVGEEPEEELREKPPRTEYGNEINLHPGRACPHLLAVDFSDKTRGVLLDESNWREMVRRGNEHFGIDKPEFATEKATDWVRTGGQVNYVELRRRGDGWVEVEVKTLDGQDYVLLSPSEHKFLTTYF